MISERMDEELTMIFYTRMSFFVPIILQIKRGFGKKGECGAEKGKLEKIIKQSFFLAI